MIYADTSLLLPVYLPEVNSEIANSTLKGLKELLISDLTVAEFLVGLARKVKLGTLPQNEADQVRVAFEQHMEDGFLRRVAVVSAHSEAAGGDLESDTGAVAESKEVGLVDFLMPFTGAWPLSSGFDLRVDISARPALEHDVERAPRFRVFDLAIEDHMLAVS